jgi:DNA-binding CsgD family transcriptional regulator
LALSESCLHYLSKRNSTAKFHVGSIITKLGAKGRTDAVARALRLARDMI